MTVSALVVGSMAGLLTWNLWAALIAAVAGALGAALLTLLFDAAGS